LFGAGALHAQAGPYDPQVGFGSTDAIARDDPRIIGWATSGTIVRGSADISDPGAPNVLFGSVSNAYGAADAMVDDGTPTVSLGDGGMVTMTFGFSIQNYAGPDFAIFENGFVPDGLTTGAAFLELAHVEVSSDGLNFFRFDSVSLTQTSTQTLGGDGGDPYGNTDASDLHNLAGKYIAGYGTPFDLQELAGVSPLLDIDAVTHIRVIDVVGSIDSEYGTLDSMDNLINDPFTTFVPQGGFDLDAIAILIPEPASGSLLLLSGLAGLAMRRRRVQRTGTMPRVHHSRRGFTLVELLVGIAILAVLTSLIFVAAGRAIDSANTTAAQNKLRQLAMANLSYAGEHGTYCPAQSADNKTRWHGARDSSGEAWDPARGYLAPYMRDGHYLELCPLLSGHENVSTFEEGAGGYGYNAAYIGGTASQYGWDYAHPNRPGNVPNPAQTVMFTTTAFARAGGLQEYPYTEPPKAAVAPGFPAKSLQPSTHFRASGGRAIVAWCDGSVSLVEKNDASGPEYYGGNSENAQVGWFGPMEHNGYWNPKYAEQVSRGN